MSAPIIAPLQTEFAFALPKGYQDTQGNLHRDGLMRLATAMDEIAPLRDARVKDNPAYLAILLLARVIPRLGSLAVVNTDTIENLFAVDLAYLQDFYRRINGDGADAQTVTCPQCHHAFAVEANQPGES